MTVNLYQGLDSAVYMQLCQSKPLQYIVTSQILRNFADKRWIIKISTVTVSRTPIFHQTDGLFWNGKNTTQLRAIWTDFSLRTNTEVTFTFEHLYITVEFSGDAHLQYQVRHL